MHPPYILIYDMCDAWCWPSKMPMECAHPAYIKRSSPMARRHSNCDWAIYVWCETVYDARRIPFAHCPVGFGISFFGVQHSAHSWPVCPPRHTYAQHTRYYTKNHENQNTNFYCLFELIKNLPATLNVISQETLTDESRENNRNKYLMKFETNTLAVNFCE